MADLRNAPAQALCAALLGGAVTARATAQGHFGLPIHGPVSISVDDAFSASSPEVAGSTANTWIAVWDSSAPVHGAGTDDDIFYARSTDGGSTWSAPALLNTNAAVDNGDDDTPLIATDDRGTWVAVWVTRDSLGGQIGTDSDVVTARSQDDGLTWSDPAPLADYAFFDDDSEAQPHLCMAGAAWMVVWWSEFPLDGIGSSQNIFAVRSTDGGLTWSDPIAIWPSVNTDNQPRAAGDGKGNWVVVWRRRGGDDEIAVAHSQDDGATWSDGAILNGDHALDGSEHDTRPDIGFGQGVWLATWRKDLFDLGAEVAMARSTDGGTTWTEPAPLNTTWKQDGSIDRPRVATDALGRWVAIWTTTDPMEDLYGFDSDLFVARSTDHGLTWTDPIAFNADAIADTWQDTVPSAATNGDGTWLAAWQRRQVDLGVEGRIVVGSFRFGDCNGNGVADEVDVGRGRSADVNGNDVPDECEPDCNGNLIPDPLDLVRGTSPDCNRNLVPDECDTARPDVDCNSNGVPDECEFTAEYQVDHGHLDGQGFLTGSGDHLWGVQYDADAGEVIHSISFAFLDSLPLGHPITVHLWDDPNNDGFPDDVVLTRSIQSEVATMNVPGTGTPVVFQTLAIPPTPIAGSFFVGLAVSTDGIENGAPMTFDQTDPQPGRCWWAASPDPAGFAEAQLVEETCCVGPVDWMIRANGNDAAGNGILDECEASADIDGDGLIDVTDLLLVLTTWGLCPNPPTPCIGDANLDGVVNIADLILVVLGWG